MRLNNHIQSQLPWKAGHRHRKKLNIRWRHSTKSYIVYSGREVLLSAWTQDVQVRMRELKRFFFISEEIPVTVTHRDGTQETIILPRNYNFPGEHPRANPGISFGAVG